MHIIRVRFLGPTGTSGSRFSVTDLWTGERRTVSYDYAARDARIAAIREAFPDADSIELGGATAGDDFYAVQIIAS